ncbi:MAG: hypothetical protein R3C55_14000 [Parvularculaceae bacterium]
MKLKLNSYDLGVDGVARHHPAPSLRTAASRTAKVDERAGPYLLPGANIYMLGASSHAWKELLQVHERNA